MSTNFSLKLHRIAKQDDRIESYEFDAEYDGGQHWLHLASGYWLPFPDCVGSIGEPTVQEALDQLRRVEPGCSWCKSNPCECKK